IHIAKEDAHRDDDVRRAVYAIERNVDGLNISYTSQRNRYDIAANCNHAAVAHASDPYHSHARCDCRLRIAANRDIGKESDDYRVITCRPAAATLDSRRSSQRKIDIETARASMRFL